MILKISEVLTRGTLTKHEALALRGRLGFADSFLHGRLGKLVLKQILEHAYSRKKELDSDTCQALMAMKTRLDKGQPMTVSENNLRQWFAYTDAAFERGSCTWKLFEVVWLQSH